jgi:hypothetical protein
VLNYRKDGMTAGAVLPLVFLFFADGSAVAAAQAITAEMLRAHR